MPFKRAVWLQPSLHPRQRTQTQFQCPLSGQFGCNWEPVSACPYANVSMPFKRAVWLQQDMPFSMEVPERFKNPLNGQFGCNYGPPKMRTLTPRFQCPLSGQFGCNDRRANARDCHHVSMPFKRAVWLQRRKARAVDLLA